MLIDRYIQQWARQILKESEELDEHIGTSYNRDYDWAKADSTKTTTKDAPDYSGESNEKRGRLECASMLLNNIVNTVPGTGGSERYANMLKQKYDYDILIDDISIYQPDATDDVGGIDRAIMVNNFFFSFYEQFSTEVKTMLIPSYHEVDWSKKSEDKRVSECIKDLVFQLSKQIKVTYGMKMNDYGTSAVVTLQPGTYTIESQFYKTKHTIKIIIKCKESDSYFYGGALTELLTSDWLRDRKITADFRDFAKRVLGGKHDIDLSKLPKEIVDKLNQAANNLKFFIQQPEKKPNLPNESEEM